MKAQIQLTACFIKAQMQHLPSNRLSAASALLEYIPDS
ncbi:MAG: hypothetical protein RHS_2906 [Robinsoniella sp. RHS]|nr:MAG: hypothetical protein RHS_2906 [Robinsoniella sp. RHS]